MSTQRIKWVAARGTASVRQNQVPRLANSLLFVPPPSRMPPYHSSSSPSARCDVLAGTQYSRTVAWLQQSCTGLVYAPPKPRGGGVIVRGRTTEQHAFPDEITVHSMAHVTRPMCQPGTCQSHNGESINRCIYISVSTISMNL